MNLVIVESPTKAKTIHRFLGSGYKVESSYGHVRDLPRSKLGVDTENNFEPHYVVPRKVSSVVKRLRDEAKKADIITLATDEDREGEAIAWHLIQALKLDESKKIHRIVFHEITKRAIEEALKSPRDIDIKRVDAQQARRVLDRLVGYKLSPFLWKKIYRGLSAGRVQSVAVRLIVDREREVENFKPQEYWTIEALLKPEEKNETFTAVLVKIGEETLDKFAIKNEKEAKKITKGLEGTSWLVERIEKKDVTKNPLPPFTTSTLQQDAFRRLGFSAKQTMMFAQQLYEGIELDEGSIGLITYMRTDSLNISNEALSNAKDFLNKEFGGNYTLKEPRRFKTKIKGAQEAHEAVRPTNPFITPESIKNYLNQKQYKLYDLIWRRFIATQMPSATFESNSVDVTAGKYKFRATGQIMKFDGFLKVYPMKFSENVLPDMKEKDGLELQELKPAQHFTEPPPRYSEASLIKTLEKYGIGRPSTYAPIISTIQGRGYVEKFQRRLKPTEVGTIVNDLLVEHFPKIVDLEFTANMEKELDEVAEGGKEWQKVIKDFYEPFAKELEKKYEKVEKQNFTEETDEVCEKCGKSMVIKLGRFGKFLACSGFPECRNTKQLKQNKSLGIKCPKCSEGEIVMKRTKKGRMFYGCNRWPDCDYASWTKPEENSTTPTTADENRRTEK